VVLWLHVPDPLQVPTFVCAPEAHEVVPHATDEPAYLHAVASTPLQVAAHAPVPEHAVREPCGVPVTVTHVPSAPETSHAWHWPPHAVLQQ